ncbi:MAG: hypothetical protein OXD42_12365 [Rhodospirillaceae bacterium]|nr:hypothetical protein [Rhodospirillaceae bacterium]MCY4237229.1 hypothetical protein [Rhodospirillaceae bacterium]
MVEYATDGLIGLLTPQANTTVEPEMTILLPPRVAAMNARLVSDAHTLSDRLRSYISQIDAVLDRFANAPLDAYAFACTGPSYLIGADQEKGLVKAIEEKRGRPLVTAAQAACDALSVIGANRIGLVSPYPAFLTEASILYWQSCEFEVAMVHSTDLVDAAFHPIYAQGNGDATAGISALKSQASVDAILLLGTGMPTLAAIASHAERSDFPVLSCMSALGWRTLLAIADTQPNSSNLRPFLTAGAWRSRLAERTG